MDGQVLIESLTIRNLLSFPLKGERIKLGPLNVLIGPNASGKSNVIHALDLIHAFSQDLTRPFRGGGSVDEWRWRGAGGKGPSEVSAVVPFPAGGVRLVHEFGFLFGQGRPDLVGEGVYRFDPRGCLARPWFFKRTGTSPSCELAVRSSDEQPLGDAAGRKIERMDVEKIGSLRSVLQMYRSPDVYPEITYLASQYERIKLYRDWELGPRSVTRKPQSADLPGDFLEENAGNLALVVNALEHDPGALESLKENLRKLCPRLEHITTRIVGGTVQLYFHEEGLDYPLSAARISDGVLRYLSLLTILCHPSPPPLICIEEPELGLHPDVLPAVAELLIEASQRTQLIVTTHSDVLVSGLSEVPESVLVCERDEEGTHLRRLDKERLKKWLEEYKLGDLWLMGEIGGTAT